MKLFNILAAAAALMLCPSCTKYLDIKPFDKVLPETAEDFSALLHYHINFIDEGSDNWLVPTFGTTSTFDAAYGDDFEVCLSSTSSRLPAYVGSYITTNGYNEPYSKLYAYIRDANIVLRDMKEQGTKEADEVRATAYAIRGVAYYQLMRMFCEVPDPANLDSQLGLPMVTEFDMSATPPRGNMATLIAQIESDLKASIEFNISNTIYRFTPDVCRGYLARLYFWSRQWDKALEMSQSLLAKYPLQNIDGYQSMMNEFGKLTGNELIKAYRSISTSNNNGLAGINVSISARPISIRFISAFSEQDKADDIRYTMAVNSKRASKKPIFCGMRAAEFKLIEAEALYHLGRKNEALAAINELRRNRVKDASDFTVDALPTANPKESITVDVNGNQLTPLLSLILTERRKELFMEGDRFFEMKRNGRPEYITFYNGTRYYTKSYMYTFPIPIRDLDICPDLKQNPGYTEFINRY